MTQQSVLIVSGLNEMFAYRTALCLADDQFSLSVASPKGRSSLLASRHVSGVSTIPIVDETFDASAVTKALMAAVGAHQPDVIFPTDLVAQAVCAAAADHLAVPVIASPTIETVNLCNDKARFAQLLDRIGCRQPDAARVIDSRDEIDEIGFEYPMIVKPVTGGGGIGVARVDTRQELADHMTSGRPGTTPPLLLQEFIPGQDIDCSFYAEDGQILASAVQTRRHPSDPSIEFTRNDQVVQVCEAVVNGLSYEGLGHMDLRIDERDGSVRVIELNPRVWASVHYAHFAGANFPALAVHRALGREPKAPEQPLGRCNNPRLKVMAALRGLLGRPITAPSDLNSAEQLMFVAKHADPLPTLLIAARSRLWWLRSRISAALASVTERRLRHSK